MATTRILAAALVLAAAVAAAQPAPAPAPSASAPAAAPAAAASPAPAPSPASRTVSGIRNKVSAADLPSAESILEVHGERYGLDGGYLVALGWLSRGALLLGETERAGELNVTLRRLCDARLAAGPGIEKDDSLRTALGAAIEVEAQLRARAKGRDGAARWLQGELAKFAGAPVSFRSRLQKRLALLSLAGQPAPELAIEDWTGGKPATLAARRGKPVVIYVWSHTCGDCRAQAASLARVAAKHASSGLEVVPLTRYYEEDHAREKAEVDSVWRADYAALGAAPVVFSTASMERYGGSSTPTFVFVDRRGVVRWYTPTRLTEEQLDRAVRDLLR